MHPLTQTRDAELLRDRLLQEFVALTCGVFTEVARREDGVLVVKAVRRYPRALAPFEKRRIRAIIERRCGEVLNRSPGVVEVQLYDKP